MAANDDFLSTYAPLANDIATRTGLDPSVVLGIIHTETGGGVHVLGNNIFGITPPGGVARYPDVQTAAQAFVSLMQSRRYAGVANAPDPASQAAALVKGGYNTANPAYASIVTQKALSFGKQLGYQDSSSSTPVPPVPPPGATPSVSINATSSVPAPNYNDQSTTTPASSPPAPQPAAPAQPPAPDYNIPPKPAAASPPASPAPAPAQPPAAPQPQQQQGAPKSLTAELEHDTGASSQQPASAQSPQPQDNKPKSLTDELERDIKNPPAGGGLTGPPERPSLVADLKAPRDTSQGYFAPDGSYVPPQAMPSKEQASKYDPVKALLGLPDQLSPDQVAAIHAPTPLENVLQAGREGWESAPTILPPGQTVSPSSGLGVNRPLVTIGNALLGAGSAAFRGGQEFVYQSLKPYDEQLARDVAALPEAFPLFGEELGGFHPAAPATYADARAGANRNLLQVGPSRPPPVTLDDLTGAVRRADITPAPPQAPPAAEVPNALKSDQAATADATPQPSAAASPLNPDQAARDAAAQADLEARMRSSAETLRQAREARGAADGSTFLGRDFMQNAGQAADGYDMGKGGAALVGEVRDALGRGDTVHLFTDGGRKTVPITGVNDQGMMVDAQGQPWGSSWIAADPTGREGVRITPGAATQAAHDTAGAQAEAPQPQAAGAQATPTGDIPAQRNVERARNLRVSINESAADRAGSGLRDDTMYVTNLPGGSTLPTRMEAERDFSTLQALNHKYAYNQDENYRAAVDKHEAARNEGMVDLLRNDAGDELTLDQARTTRRTAAPDAFGAFDGERPVPAGAQSLERHINDVLASPEGKRDAVERTLNNVKAKLYDRDGNLETTPSQLYGVRQHINDLMDKAARPLDREGTDAQAARFKLRDLLDRTDQVIQSGAEKYGAYRQAYRDLSQPVNQERFLQRYQQGNKKLTGSDGKLILSKVNTMLEDIHKGLTDQKFNLAQSLTGRQIQNIINVRNELAAKKFKTDQGAVPGSPTFQLFSRAAEKGGGALGALLHSGGGLAAHAVATHMGFPGAAEAGAIYSATAPFVRMARQQRRLRLAQQKDAALKARLLSQPDNPLSQY